MGSDEPNEPRGVAQLRSLLSLRFPPEKVDEMLRHALDPERMLLEPQTAHDENAEVAAQVGRSLTKDEWVGHLTRWAPEIEAQWKEMLAVVQRPAATAMIGLIRRAENASDRARVVALLSHVAKAPPRPPIPAGLRFDAKVQRSLEARAMNTIRIIAHGAEGTYRPILTCALGLAQLERGETIQVPDTLGGIIHSLKPRLVTAEFNVLVDPAINTIRAAQSHAGVSFSKARGSIILRATKTAKKGKKVHRQEQVDEMTEADLMAVGQRFPQLLLELSTAIRVAFQMLDRAS